MDWRGRICHPRSSLAFAGRDAGPYSLSLIHPIENRFFIRVPISCVIHTRSDLYRGEKKGLQIVLSYSQAGPGRKAKLGQEEISHNHVPTFFLSSVHNAGANGL